MLQPAAPDTLVEGSGRRRGLGGAASKDLRSFLRQLAAHDPDQIMVDDQEVDPVFEATALVERLRADRGFPKFPAVLFKKVRGSDIHLLLNLHGTYARVALSIDATVQTMIQEYGRRRSRPGTIERVAPGAAPVKEVILAGEQANLGLLPLLHHQERDAGKFITSAVTITRDLETGVQNAGIFRHQLWGPQELGFHPNPRQNTGYILWQHQQRKLPLPVALVIGHHPALLMSAASRPGGIGGELEAASALLEQPLEMVRAETVDLEVPARAEIVIEGLVDTDPQSYREEGPFGEYPRYYTGVGPQPWVKVTAITMRRDPIYVDVFNAHDEHLVVGGLPHMGTLLARLRAAHPTVTALNLPLSGGARMHAYISMKKRIDGEPRYVAFAALSHDAILKHVFIVDDDIDVFDEEQVLWALATRFQADRDLTVISNSLGGRLNPSSYAHRRDEGGIMETKLIFDCTRPAPPTPFPEACRVPPEVVARMDPAACLRPLYQGDVHHGDTETRRAGIADLRLQSAD